MKCDAVKNSMPSSRGGPRLVSSGSVCETLKEHARSCVASMSNQRAVISCLCVLGVTATCFRESFERRLPGAVCLLPLLAATLRHWYRQVRPPDWQKHGEEHALRAAIVGILCAFLCLNPDASNRLRTTCNCSGVKRSLPGVLEVLFSLELCGLVAMVLLLTSMFIIQSARFNKLVMSLRLIILLNVSMLVITTVVSGELSSARLNDIKTRFVLVIIAMLLAMYRQVQTCQRPLLVVWMLVAACCLWETSYEGAFCWTANIPRFPFPAGVVVYLWSTTSKWPRVRPSGAVVPAESVTVINSQADPTPPAPMPAMVLINNTSDSIFENRFSTSDQLLNTPRAATRPTSSSTPAEFVGRPSSRKTIGLRLISFIERNLVVCSFGIAFCVARLAIGVIFGLTALMECLLYVVSIVIISSLYTQPLIVELSPTQRVAAAVCLHLLYYMFHLWETILSNSYIMYIGMGLVLSWEMRNRRVSTANKTCSQIRR